MNFSRPALTALLFRLVPILFASLPTSALADEYQDVVSKAFPGYQILEPSQIKLEKNEMDPEIYNRVKDHPGLVVGRFNSDEFLDFAALIRDSKKKVLAEDRLSKRPAIDYYDGYLVACYGVGAREYKCEKLTSDPMRILQPHLDYLMKTPPGSEMCSILMKFKAPKPKRDPNVGEHGEGPAEITFRTDAIGLFGLSAVVYVAQPHGMYLECSVGH